VTVEKRPVTEAQEYVGRVRATDRVDVVARVTETLTERAFAEGTEVHAGDLLYRLDRAPFEATLAAQQAAVAQMQALLKNATLAANRARSLLATPAGQRSQYDDALAQQASYAAQLEAAEAQARIAAINLGYTEIRAPISGKIGRSAFAVGNVVTPSSGPLVSIVSQDPMYVLFPVPTRDLVQLRARYGARGGLAAIAVRLRLPDGSLYGRKGTLDFVDPTVAQDTDTVMLRARMPNPLREGAQPGGLANRDLIDGAFVTVLLEDASPEQALTVPRAAVLQDAQGNFVYVLGAENKVEVRRIRLGQTQGVTAVVASGLKEGETIVADGLQRVRPGIAVNPAPAGGPAGGPAGAPKPAG
jgi:membrane fusion protein (multidrug efflux system)